MKRILYFVSLILLSIGLVAATFILKDKKDTQAPVITLPAGELSYTDGSPVDELLNGVSAWDNRDGDLSSEVFVYEVVPIQATGMAKVVYAVSDSSCNVAEADLMVRYEKKKEVARLGPNGEPVLRLNASGVSITKGDIFDPYTYIQSAFDDKDSRDDLLGNLVVKGGYDLTRIGHYRLQMYVTDSEGNESNKAEFLLVVE